MNIKEEKFKIKFINSLKSIFKKIDLESIDNILDSRDSTIFSNQWQKAWSKIETKNLNLEKEREKIFKLIYNETNSGDLSAYITEDFELIVNYIELKDNNWVTSLCHCYFNELIPKGEIKSSKKTLLELINE
ncbi:hypothetical protein LNI88_11695 [Tenacibaculum dicentrarchi]|nr:hypothetical protein [Tenacibaculum dicentrarchi]MCD8425974.1 hypothetical protein [Tenacibaculum dicentrarchi]MCD8443253.1 hypothetical protein [Tenacibaculum dicentrarchi]